MLEGITTSKGPSVPRRVSAKSTKLDQVETKKYITAGGAVRVVRKRLTGVVRPGNDNSNCKTGESMNENYRRDLDKLIELRLALGISRSELAKASGLWPAKINTSEVYAPRITQDAFSSYLKGMIALVEPMATAGNPVAIEGMKTIDALRGL